MSTTMKEVRDAVMSLSLGERASLAHDLILSLDEPSAFDLGPEREAEIARRVQSVREGAAKGRPASEVFGDVRAKLGR